MKRGVLFVLLVVLILSLSGQVAVAKAGAQRSVAHEAQEAAAPEDHESVDQPSEKGEHGAKASSGKKTGDADGKERGKPDKSGDKAKGKCKPDKA